MKRILAFTASLMLAVPALAHEVTVGDLQIIHANIPQPAASAKAAGGFMAISNNGTEADRLIGVEADFAAKAETHESKVDGNGVGTMEHVDFIEIPPGQTVNLEHGGYHIMFMGLKRPLAKGTKVPVTLRFQRAGAVKVQFAVQQAGAMNPAAMNHAGH